MEHFINNILPLSVPKSISITFYVSSLLGYGAGLLYRHFSHRFPYPPIRNTTFPVFCPLATYRYAPFTSSIGYCRSITA